MPSLPRPMAQPPVKPPRFAAAASAPLLWGVVLLLSLHPTLAWPWSPRGSVTVQAAGTPAVTPSTPFYALKHESQFYNMAKQGLTDKITQHHYEALYTKYFEPPGDAGRRFQRLKILEIGLGCDMTHGAGHSAHLWRHYFPHADLWFGEYNGDCVAKHKPDLDKLGIRVVTGDQGDLPTLDRWLKETGGEFDVIIDDGGHTNMQMFNTAAVLFDKALKPGGIYFIEDLLAARYTQYVDGDKKHVMTEVLKDWLEGLIMSVASPIGVGEEQEGDFRKAGQTQYLQLMGAGPVPFLPEYPLLPGVKMLDCSSEMCALIKCRAEDERCPLGLPKGPAKGQVCRGGEPGPGPASPTHTTKHAKNKNP